MVSCNASYCGNVVEHGDDATAWVRYGLYFTGDPMRHPHWRILTMLKDGLVIMYMYIILWKMELLTWDPIAIAF